MTKKGGLADSPFFMKPLSTEASQPTPKKVTRKKRKISPSKDASQSSNHETVIPRHHDTKLGIMTPRYQDDIIEGVRKAVKEFGKEAATHRFTLEEKKAIADLIYTYKQRGTKTSENEIARIAINYLIRDYRENGENSMLHKVLEALNT